MIFTQKNNKGILNEVNFAKMIDNKKVSELPIKIQEMLLYLFKNISQNDYVECWQSKFNEKADIKIKINGDIKGISIKMGQNNSIHQESLISLTNFLLNIGLENSIKAKLKAYIHGKINDTKVDITTYKKANYQEIIEINEALNDFYIKTLLAIRFIFIGKVNPTYDADAIIHGTPDNFLWASKSEILYYVLNYPQTFPNNIKIGPLTIQCLNRNLKQNANAKCAENYIQIKWYSLKKDLLYITEKRKNILKNTNKIK